MSSPDLCCCFMFSAIQPSDAAAPARRHANAQDRPTESMRDSRGICGESAGTMRLWAFDRPPLHSTSNDPRRFGAAR